MLAIYKREFLSYFRAPIGWVAVALFALISGFYFVTMLGTGSVNIASEFSFLCKFFMVLIPLITMRLFSEEKKNGTEVLLYTSPVPMYKIVIGKYLAAISLQVLMLSGVFLHMIVLIFLSGRVDASSWGACIGYLFLSALFIAIGMMCSALTENQIVAAVVSFVVILFSQMLGTVATSAQNLLVSLLKSTKLFGLSEEAIYNAGVGISNAINWIDPFSKTSDFSAGIFGIVPLFFCLSFAALFVFLTYRLLEKKRWSQG